MPDSMLLLALACALPWPPGSVCTSDCEPWEQCEERGLSEMRSSDVRVGLSISFDMAGDSCFSSRGFLLHHSTHQPSASQRQGSQWIFSSAGLSLGDTHARAGAQQAGWQPL